MFAVVWQARSRLPHEREYHTSQVGFVHDGVRLFRACLVPLLLIALMYIAAITGQQKQLRHIPFLPFPVVNTCIHAFVCIVMLDTSVLYNRVMCLYL